MLSRLIRPPRLRTAGVEGEIRRATWMELFYDLVFVVAVAQLGSRLSGDHSLSGVLKFVALVAEVLVRELPAGSPEPGPRDEWLSVRS